MGVQNNRSHLKHRRGHLELSVENATKRVGGEEKEVLAYRLKTV